MRTLFFISLLLVSAWKVSAQEGKYGFQYNGESDYYYFLPADFQPDNKTELYPLIIYLHGGGGKGNINGLDFLGNSENSIQGSNPAFVLVPQSERGWDPGKINPLIEKFLSDYPVDQRRIYLIGYSMGGSGSYIIANGLYDYNQTLFAAIIRLAGQSQTSLRDEIAENTAVWFHIGLDDGARVDITREAYNFLKAKHPGAKESVKSLDINGIAGTTFTLKGKGFPQVKRTEYEGVGHGISRFPFNNEQLMSWLFNQKLP